MRAHDDYIVAALDAAILQVSDHLTDLEETRNRRLAELQGEDIARRGMRASIDSAHWDGVLRTFRSGGDE